MQKVTLGRTGLAVAKNGFGALPIQRISVEAAGKLLRRALDSGFDFFDTARFYTDSETKIGAALADRRDAFVLATKTGATTVDGFWKDLEMSLSELRTDHVDLYQFHNLPFVPKPEGEDGLYAAMLEARRQGKIRFIGLTNHRLALAREAVESGLYDTLQFPFSYLSTPEEQDLVRLCAARGVGFIAMKALAGGLITDARLAYAFFGEFPNAVPIWGIQRERELDDFIAAAQGDGMLGADDRAKIEADRKELSGAFCRGCGYCMPCPEGIEINNCARMTLLLTRAPHAVYLTEDFHEKMERITACRNCGQCRSRCPYHLDTPALLQANLADFRKAWVARSVGGQLSTGILSDPPTPRLRASAPPRESLCPGMCSGRDTFGEYVFQVRSYECNRNGFATLPTICNYLQEAASRNAESLGFSKSDFAAAGSDISWVLTKMKVKMNRYPKWEDEVKVLTFPRGGRKIVAWRDFVITDGADEVLGVATTEWMIIDLVTRKIVPIPQHVFDAANTVREPVLGLEPFSRFKYPGDARSDGELRFTAQHAQIDLNGHVNNVHYIAWMLEPMPDCLPNEMEIVFRSETFAGDEVRVCTTPGPSGETFHRVFSPDGHDHVTAVTRAAPVSLL